MLAEYLAPNTYTSSVRVLIRTDQTTGLLDLQLTKFRHFNYVESELYIYKKNKQTLRPNPAGNRNQLRNTDSDLKTHMRHTESFPALSVNRLTFF